MLVYVDGEYVGGASGVPTLVGKGKLAFSKDGIRVPLSSLPAQDPPAYLLDPDQFPGTSDISVSINWAGKSTENISVNFDAIAFTDSPSLISSVLKQNEMASPVK